MQIIATSVKDTSNNFLHSGYVSAAEIGLVKNANSVMSSLLVVGFIFFISLYFLLRKIFKKRPTLNKIYLGFIVLLVIIIMLTVFDYIDWSNMVREIYNIKKGSGDVLSTFPGSASFGQ